MLVLSTVAKGLHHGVVDGVVAEQAIDLHGIDLPTAEQAGVHLVVQLTGVGWAEPTHPATTMLEVEPVADGAGVGH